MLKKTVFSTTDPVTVESLQSMKLPGQIESMPNSQIQEVLGIWSAFVDVVSPRDLGIFQGGYEFSSLLEQLYLNL